MSIAIKSNLKDRVRLKSDLFTKKNEEFINQILEDKVIDLRFNLACNSLIIKFNSLEISLNDILDLLYEYFKISSNLLEDKLESSLKTCNDCYVCKKTHSKKTWKRKVYEIVGLSVVAVVVFVKEHILATPFSAISNIALGSLSVVAALPLLNEAKNDILNKKFSLETFMAFSLLLAIFGGEIAAAFEVIYILRASRLFEEYTAQKSRIAIKNLIEMDVKQVYVLNGDVEIQTNLEDVKKGDIVVCVNGEKICVDGEVVYGEGYVDESIINGHSQAIYKEIGSSVFANTTLNEGKIHIKVNAVGNETYISRVINDVEKHLSLKSTSEIEADKLAKKVLKLGSFMTVATLFLTGSFTNAFSVMIIMSCPCATILAASSAVSSAIASAAKNGILIKGGEHLEKISKADIVCFDKTGTLTTNTPIVLSYETKLDEDEFFQVLSNLEHKNTHPIAKAVSGYCQNLGFEPTASSNSCSVVGLGVKGEFDDNKYLLGNKKFMIDNSIRLPYNSNFLKNNEHATIIFLAKNSKFAGCLSISHEIRDGSKETILELKKRGVKKIVLLTGDDELVANEFAKEFEFDAVYPNLMPDEKANIINSFSKKGITLMIGDGVNDTLAMSRADISVSFASGGSEAAIEVSNIAITNSDPKDIIKLFDLSNLALKKANQNYKIGTSTNILGSILAMFGTITPAAAGLIHLAHTGAILYNSSKVKI